MTSIQPLEHVSFQDPDEVREGANWRLELVNLAGGAQVGVASQLVVEVPGPVRRV